MIRINEDHNSNMNKRKIMLRRRTIEPQITNDYVSYIEPYNFIENNNIDISSKEDTVDKNILEEDTHNSNITYTEPEVNKLQELEKPLITENIINFEEIEQLNKKIKINEENIKYINEKFKDLSVKINETKKLLQEIKRDFGKITYNFL